MAENHLPIDQAWDYGTFEGLERRQLQDWMELTPSQKLEWLEQAHELVDAMRIWDPSEKNRPANETPTA